MNHLGVNSLYVDCSMTGLKQLLSTDKEHNVWLGVNNGCAYVTDEVKSTMSRRHRHTAEIYKHYTTIIITACIWYHKLLYKPMANAVE